MRYKTALKAVLKTFAHILLTDKKKDLTTNHIVKIAQLAGLTIEEIFSYDIDENKVGQRVITEEMIQEYLQHHRDPSNYYS